MERRVLTWLSWIKKTAGVTVLLLSAFLMIRFPALAAGTGAAAHIDLKDGEYSVDVTLGGGSGRASVVSPAVLTVKDGTAFARIAWSSPNYDYMKIGNEIYDPVNKEGNSVFEIPVSVFDEEIPVAADTTAMSVPHEISYTLTFHLDSVRKGRGETVLKALAAAVCLAAGAAVILFVWRTFIKGKK